MAVEIIIQIGGRDFWKQFDDMKSYMKLSYQIILNELRKRLTQFAVANAVVHLDEDSPHMHIVGVFVITALSGCGNLTLAMISFCLYAVGMFVLGL